MKLPNLGSFYVKYSGAFIAGAFAPVMTLANEGHSITFHILPICLISGVSACYLLARQKPVASAK